MKFIDQIYVITIYKNGKFTIKGRWREKTIEDYRRGELFSIIAVSALAVALILSQ